MTHHTLADALWRARLEGTVIDTPSDSDLGDGYAVQAEIVTLAGDPVPGWKVGSTSPEAQARLGTSEPGAGALLKRFCFTTGAEVPVFPQHEPFVEVEFVFEMGQTLSPRTTPYSYEEVKACVAHCRPGLELVGSRIQGGLSGIGRAGITADGGGNVAFVSGPPAPHWREADLPATEVALLIDGSEAASGLGARALGDPMNVMVWLANHLSRRGLDFPAGSLVSTGTCTGLVEVAPGQHLVGRFGPLGEVHCELVEAKPDAREKN